MSTVAIETLLQTVAAPRPPEPPLRLGDDRGAFRPALDNALRGEGALAPTSCPPKLAEASADVNEDMEMDEHELDRQDDAMAETIEADAAGPSDTSDDEEARGEDDDDKDAVEISDEASAVATSAQSDEKALPDADAALQDGEAAVKALADAKQSGEQLPGQSLPALPNESNGEAQSSEAASQPARVEKETPAGRAKKAQDEAAAKQGVDPGGAAESRSAPESSSGAAGEEHDGQAATEDHENQAAAVTAKTRGTDDDHSPSADATGRDGHRAAVGDRNSDASQAAADSSVRSPINAADPTPNDSSASSGVTPVSATSASEPAAARVAASIARFSSGRTPQGGAGHSDFDGTGQVDRARFVGRVEGAIRTAHQRDGRVHVRLSPPELGSLRIELTVQNGALSARLEAETPAARNLLLDNLPALRDRLAQQDIRVERFDVDVRSDGGGSNQQQNAQDRSAGDPTAGQRDERRGRPAVRPTAVTRGPLGGGASTNTNAALDVRV